MPRSRKSSALPGWMPDQEVEHAQRAVLVLVAKIDGLEVAQDALEHVLAPAGTQHSRLELHVAVEDAVEAVLAVFLGEQGAAVERVDEQRARGSVHPHHEVSGQADALHLEAGAARDFHEDGGQRDRDARATVEHLVEVAVARVVVALRVAAEALLLEQVVVEGHDRALGSRFVVEPPPQRYAHLVQPRQVGTDVQIGVLLRSHEQRRFGEVHLAIGPREDHLEPAACTFRRVRAHVHELRTRSIPAGPKALARCSEATSRRTDQPQAPWAAGAGSGASPSSSRTRGTRQLAAAREQRVAHDLVARRRAAARRPSSC